MRTAQFFIAAAMVASAVPMAAEATVTYNDRGAFLGDNAGASSVAIDFGTGTSFPTTYSNGPLTVSAVDGALFGSGQLLSTELDGDTLVLTFADPIKAIGLTGGVTGEFGDYVDGFVQLLTDVGGAGGTIGTSGGFIGFVADDPFTVARFRFTSFDTGATSVAFAQIEQQVDYIRAGNTGGAVPEPATWAMMIAGFGLTGAVLRRRTAVRFNTVAA